MLNFYSSNIQYINSFIYLFYLIKSHLKVIQIIQTCQRKIETLNSIKDIITTSLALESLIF